MKKDGLHPDKFEQNQEVVLKFATKFKNERWTSYSKEEHWIVESLSKSQVILRLKSDKKTKCKLTSEQISSGMVRIVKLKHNEQ